MTANTRCKKVLFVCGHNAGRSQMAEAFTRHLADGRIEVASAGTMPSEALNPTVVAVMEELGINMEHHHPKLLTPDLYQGEVCVFRMGWNVVLPPEVRAENWQLEDPYGQPIEKVREIRNAIREHVETIIL